MSNGPAYRACEQVAQLTRMPSAYSYLIWVPKQAAVQALGPVLLLPGQESQFTAPPAAERATSPDCQASRDKNPGSSKAQPAASPGQHQAAGLLSWSQSQARPTPLAPESKPRPCPKMDPNSCPPPPKDVTSRHTQKPKLSQLLKNCFYKHEPEKSRKGNHSQMYRYKSKESRIMKNHVTKTPLREANRAP